MKPLHFTVVAMASVVFGSASWSCNTDETPTEQSSTLSTPSMPDDGASAGAGAGMMHDLRARCPMVVQGADVTATDTEGGVALTFTTGTGDLADLRTRVQRMAQMYETHHGQGGMMWHHMGGAGMAHGGRGMGGQGMGHMAERGPMPAASATMTEADLGARLELRPTDPSQLDALRDHARWHQQRMHSGECWMLEGQPNVTPPAEQE